MKMLTRFAVAVLFLITTASQLLAQTRGPERWETEIQRFEEADRASTLAPGGVLFVGSSSIRFWRTLDEDFPTLRPLNRGFGGSGISDVLHYADRIILPYHPRLIVLYAGENDIGAGRSADAVFEDYRSIATLVRQHLPETRLVFVSIKPSPRRWNLNDVMVEANSRIAAHAQTDRMIDFVDVHGAMIGSDGLPRPELFVEDRLHLNEEGYRLWRELIAPYVQDRPGASAAVAECQAAFVVVACAT